MKLFVDFVTFVVVFFTTKDQKLTTERADDLPLVKVEMNLFADFVTFVVVFF